MGFVHIPLFLQIEVCWQPIYILIRHSSLHVRGTSKQFHEILNLMKEIKLITFAKDLTWNQAVICIDSTLPMQVFPSLANLYPFWQLHLNDPTVLLQPCEQSSVFFTHSSMSKCEISKWVL